MGVTFPYGNAEGKRHTGISGHNLSIWNGTCHDGGMSTGTRWPPSADELRLAGILRALIGPERGAQKRAAEASGISEAQLSKYLSGQKSITMAELQALCRHLNRSSWELMKIAQD